VKRKATDYEALVRDSPMEVKLILARFADDFIVKAYAALMPSIWACAPPALGTYCSMGPKPAYGLPTCGGA
jgi:hypothetical protein